MAINFGALGSAIKESLTSDRNRTQPQGRGITISSPTGQQEGATISTGGQGSFNIYRDSRDPNDSSSIATRESRMNIARGALPNIVASTNIEERQEPDAAPSFVIPAGQTITNLPETQTTMLNPQGRMMPASEQVRQQNILQSTYAPRPRVDLLSGRPVQYADSYFLSGSTRADPKFDPNIFANTFLGTDRPVPPVPEGNVMGYGDRLLNVENFRNNQATFKDNLNRVNNFLIQRGFNAQNVSVVDDELFDTASGAKLNLPSLTEIMRMDNALQ